MSISITNSSRTLAVAIGVGLVVAVALGGFAAQTHAALSSAQVQSIISLLQSFGADATTIANVQASLTGGTPSGGGSTSGGCTFTRSLTMGSSGADVTCLQQGLISMGFSIPAGATGYFGAQTQAAVSAWQTSKGVSPAAGYFGPISQAAWGTSSGGGGTSGGGTTGGGGTLSGGAGSISDADYVGSLNNEKVGEDEEDVEVAGMDLEADEGSDIEITAVRLNFSQNSADQDFDEYATEVSIWLDGEELARLDADEFMDDDGFDKTISLDSGGIIDAGDRADLVVAVSGISNLDSTDAGDTWTLEFESVRFRDAQGASVTDSDTGDINDGAGRGFSFDTFASAADVELKAAASDDTPEGVVNVDDTSDTDGVELLRFTLEAEGGDINVKDLPITFATTSGNTADTLAEITGTVYLTIDGNEYSENSSSATIGPSGATVTFDDVDVTINEGDEVDVVVSADINDTEAGAFVDGDSLTASYTASNHDSVDAEDESGENLSNNDTTGTGLGEAIAFYDVGIMVSLVSTDTELTSDSDTANTDTGSFTIVFNVEAFDGTVYVADTADATTDSSTGNTAIDETLYRLVMGGTATTAGDSSGISYTTGGGASDSTNGNIQLEDGESTDISLIVSRTNTAANGGGITQLFLQAIAWDTADNVGDSSTDQYSVFDFDLEDYKTAQMALN